MRKRQLESLRFTPVRDEAAHERFQQDALDSSERVTWKFPLVDKIENRSVGVKDITAILEHDPNHRVSLEVARLVGAYRDDFLKCLEAHERRYNKGSMPQVQIARDTPRYPVEHAAQHIFACMFQEVIIDTTEEEKLLHPQ